MSLLLMAATEQLLLAVRLEAIQPLKPEQSIGAQKISEGGPSTFASAKPHFPPGRLGL
jgi:hypothetical protein